MEDPQRRLSSRRRVIQSIKAKRNARRTRTERFADWVSNAVGTNTFLALNVVWFVIWTAINVGWVPWIHPFDPYPYEFLTMIVSLEAILLSIFVLIAQNRSERIDDLRNEVDLHVNLIAEQELTKVLQLVAAIAGRVGLDVSKDGELQEMLAPTNIDRLEKMLEEQIAGTPRNEVEKRP